MSILDPVEKYLDKLFPARVHKYSSNNFTPAAPGEKTLYGASRPGYPDDRLPNSVVEQWIEFMKKRGINRVCCLLRNDEIKDYYKHSLITQYEMAFGESNVMHSPVKDFETISKQQLYHEILPYIKETEKAGQKIVVHCSAGMGRTGQVMVAWLVRYRDMKPNDALTAVIKSGRNPLEAKYRQSKIYSPAEYKGRPYGPAVGGPPTLHTPIKALTGDRPKDWSSTWPPDRREWPTNALRLNPVPPKKDTHLPPW